MNRKELYAKVKEYNLGEEIKKNFGDNFTRVSSANLEAFVEKHEAKLKRKAETKEATKAEAKPVEPTPVVEEKKEVKKEVKQCATTDKVGRLIEVLIKKHILLPSEVSYIVG